MGKYDIDVTPSENLTTGLILPIRKMELMYMLALYTPSTMLTTDITSLRQSFNRLAKDTPIEVLRDVLSLALIEFREENETAPYPEWLEEELARLPTIADENTEPEGHNP